MKLTRQAIENQLKKAVGRALRDHRLLIWAVILLAVAAAVVMMINLLAYPKHVQLGAAVAIEPLLHDPQYAELLKRDFNVVTPENVMKFGLLHPTRDNFDFRDADTIVKFALDNNMQVHGHTLVWHEQLPQWFTEGNFTRDALITILQQHILTVVGRYRGKVFAWDVVNEAIADDGSLRDTIWLRGIGPQYIDMAFRWAHQADPQAVLFYNDYGDETPGPKANAIEALVRGMLDRHVPIQAVGLQMHISNAHAPTPEQVASIMHVFGNLGLRVDITEMDVSIQDGSGTRAEKLEAQAHIYESIARACLVSSACHVLSTWGVTDRYSWLRQTADSSDAPLLFDEMYQPKPAYRSLMQVLR